MEDAMRGKRGEFGYIAARKKKTLLLTLLYTAIAVAIFVTGLFLNKMDRQNIFTVIAVLCVLPMVKQMVGFIVIIPYKSVPKNRYDLVQKALPGDCMLLTDMVITSPDKIMHVDFSVVGDNQVLVLVAPGKQDVPYIKDYISKGVKERAQDYKVKVFQEEKSFLKALEHLEPGTEDEEQKLRILDYLCCLIV